MSNKHFYVQYELITTVAGCPEVDIADRAISFVCISKGSNAKVLVHCTWCQISNMLSTFNNSPVTAGGHFDFLAVLLISISILLYTDPLRQKVARLIVQQQSIRLGIALRNDSNIQDEFQQHNEPQKTDLKIKALFLYPIKGCYPVELTETYYSGSGLLLDRQLVLAEYTKPLTPKNASRQWIFRTLRHKGFEKLVKMKVEIALPPGKLSIEDALELGELIVRYPGKLFGLFPVTRSFFIPLTADNMNLDRHMVTIWRDCVEAVDYDPYLPPDFKNFVDAKNPITLFRVQPGKSREVFRCAPRKDELGYQSTVNFADAYPINLLNLSSVRDIADRVGGVIPQLSARRFRTNLLISGAQPYDEDNWKRIRIGTQEFYCACHTVRCTLPNVDPETGLKHPSEPDKTLKSFRCIDEGDPLNACLGLQLVPVLQAGSVRVGDKIEVLERGQHRYIKQ